MLCSLTSLAAAVLSDAHMDRNASIVVVYVLVAPFYLRLTSGARVRVEPTRKVTLVDDMDGVIRVELTRRTRSAELVPGEETDAVGELVEGVDPEAEGGGYRGSPHGLLLRPPKGSAMSLSSRPLGEGFARWTRFDGIAAAMVLFAGLLAQLIWLPFHDRLWNGETVEATVTNLRHYTTEDSEGDTIHHYEVTVDVPGVATGLADEVGGDDYPRLKRGQKLPWRIVRQRLSHSAVGQEATASAVSLVALLILPMALIVFFVVRLGPRLQIEHLWTGGGEPGRALILLALELRWVTFDTTGRRFRF